MKECTRVHHSDVGQLDFDFFSSSGIYECGHGDFLLDFLTFHFRTSIGVRSFQPSSYFHIQCHKPMFSCWCQKVQLQLMLHSLKVWIQLPHLRVLIAIWSWSIFLENPSLTK